MVRKGQGPLEMQASSSVTVSNLTESAQLSKKPSFQGGESRY